MLRWLRAAMLLSAAAAWAPRLPLRLPTPLPLRRAPRDTYHHVQLYGWQLRLQENKAIRSPIYDDCKFYKGHVVNEDSIVTVTECDGLLYGLVQVDGEQFTLQPEPAGHVLRRRDAQPGHPGFFNLTGDTVEHLDLDLGEEPHPVSHVHARHSQFNQGYFRHFKPVSRPIKGVQGLWMEIAIVADYSMVNFHGKERVKHYILALMNIVSAIFNDPSLNSNMTLVISKLFIYEEKETVVNVGNVKKSLEAVNKWNYRHLAKLPPEKEGWDAAIWLTRVSLGGPSGFAPVGGVCSRTRSAGIDKDEGLTSAFVIAHELAHLLGLTHDGEDFCKEEETHGSVMAPTVLATLHNFAWSKCSKKQFHDKSHTWWCLLERSGDSGVELGGARELPNFVFSMDDQCRTEFGEGFTVCKTMKIRSDCSRLWCTSTQNPQICRTKRAPPLEGTPCGTNKWCVNQVCERMPGRGAKRDENRGVHTGGAIWSNWSEWSTCNANCGYGLQTRFRQCLSGRSVAEGQCEGAAWQALSCWSGTPCVTLRDDRLDLCVRHANRYIPHIHTNESKNCQLWCEDYAGSEPINLGTIPDGTPCSYDRPFDICYQGACVKGSCNASDPDCNWCRDGACNNNTHYYIKKLSKTWTRLMMLPHDARYISAYISTPIPLRLALRERRRGQPNLELSKARAEKYEIGDNKYLKYDPRAPQKLRIVELDSNIIDVQDEEEELTGWKGNVVAAGSLFQWMMTNGEVSITSEGRLQSDVIIMGLPENNIFEAEMSVEVSVNYSTALKTPRPMDYKSTPRGSCSVSCGGGVRMVRTHCSTGNVRTCPFKYESCNTHSCDFMWAPGEWEDCSATCGEAGYQERQIFCVHRLANVTTRVILVKNSVSPAMCKGTTPPKKFQPCNQVPCPMYWKEMPWTECSATCGRSISVRPLVCPAVDESLCGPKPQQRRRRCRTRHCPVPRKACTRRDTEYCTIFTDEELRRNCLVPPFRKVCCNACKEVLQPQKLIMPMG